MQFNKPELKVIQYAIQQTGLKHLNRQEVTTVWYAIQ